jgi:hypothetical protein
VTIEPLPIPASEIPEKLRALADAVEKGEFNATSILLVYWDRVNERMNWDAFGEPTFRHQKIGLLHDTALEIHRKYR